MTLVERLRAEGEFTACALMIEAADLIERIDYAGTHTCHARCKRLPCVQRREIESLQRECSVLRNEIDRCNGLCISDDADRIRDQREGGKLADDKDTLEDSDERDFEAWRESK